MPELILRYILTAGFRKRLDAINWLSANNLMNGCASDTNFEFVSKACPFYPREVFEHAPENKVKYRNKLAN